MSGPVARAVGLHVAALRKARGWSQAELGHQIGAALGCGAWPRQAVSAGEKGHRAWTADEIAAVADVFGVRPGRLFEPPPCAACLGRPPAGFTCNTCAAPGPGSGG